MISAWKYESETPLDCLNRLRASCNQFETKKLSYAGRLDPMASGVLPILVGDEENGDYKKYLTANKTYEAAFLIGVTSDTGDILGRHLAVSHTSIGKEMLHIFREKVVHTKEQIYPWFSSKTVNGIKLFEHFKEGNTQIERPKRTASITTISELQECTIKTEELHNNITKKISKLRGDFRQDEILRDWDDWKASYPNKEWQLITCEMTVTTGTYIRVLADLFSTPALLFSLKRTAVGF